MEVMLVNGQFKNPYRTYQPGEVWITTKRTKERLLDSFARQAAERMQPKIKNTVKFIELDDIIKKAHKDVDFKNLLIIRSGGIGDLIALTSIIDYFAIDRNIHLVTQEKYFDLFDWFEDKPKLISLSSPIFMDLSLSKLTTKYVNWSRFQAEGMIEEGNRSNWMETFFSFIGENNPDIEFLRPQLKTDRISDIHSNIDCYLQPGKKSLLICNKASAMMRTCHVADIYKALPENIKADYQIFAYDSNMSDSDKKSLKDKVIAIKETDLSTFFLDCFDADMLISVDTGALHFREGICKPAIGLYNSFTTESRTKHYQYTNSFDIKSTCKLQPCFEHEKPNKHHCSNGKKGMFAAPCFNSKSNKTLLKQLSVIFKNICNGNKKV